MQLYGLGILETSHELCEFWTSIDGELGCSLVVPGDIP